MHNAVTNTEINKDNMNSIPTTTLQNSSESISDRECEAQLLLHLSSSALVNTCDQILSLSPTTYNKIIPKLTTTHEQTKQTLNTTTNQTKVPSKNTNNLLPNEKIEDNEPKISPKINGIDLKPTEIIVIDDDDAEEKTNTTDRPKPSNFVPVDLKRNRPAGTKINNAKRMKTTQNEIECKEEETQSEKVYVISVEEYELLKIIKDKGLTKSELVKLLTEDQKIPDNDVNNNTKHPLDSNIPMIDLSYDEVEEMEKKALNYNSMNKLILMKVAQRYEKEKEQMTQQILFSKLYVQNLIQEALLNIGNKYNPSVERADKTIQTEPKSVQDAECSTNDLIDKNKKTIQQRTNNDDTTNNVQAESLLEIQLKLGRPVVSVQNSQRQNAQSPKQPVSQIPEQLIYKAQSISPLPDQPTSKTQTLNMYNNGNYPNAPMMSALQLTEPLYLQRYYNRNHNWNSWGAKEIDPLASAPVSQGQPAVGLAAVPNIPITPTGSASFSSPQSAGLNIQASTVAALQQEKMPPIVQTYPENLDWISSSCRNKENPRPRRGPRWNKNEPSNAEGYNVKDLPTLPVQGKYQAMIRQQRLLTMAAQQRAWAQSQTCRSAPLDLSIKSFRNGG